jgi:hypothetical protein
MAGMDWNVDLTSGLEDKGVMDASVSSPPDSSTASDLGEIDFNYTYSEIYQQAESFAPPGGEDLGLLDNLLALDSAQAENQGPSTPPEAWANASDFQASPPPGAVDGLGSEKSSDKPSIPGHGVQRAGVALNGALPLGPDAVAADAGRKRKEMEAAKPATLPLYPGAVLVGATVVAGAGAATQPAAPGTPTQAARRSSSPEQDDPFGLNGRDLSTLTPEEQKLWKKQKRLIKNRESAQLSRQRKKNHMETLEMQVQRLEQERVTLSSRMDQLAEENNLLKKQLAAHGVVPQSPPAAAAAPAAAPAAAAPASAPAAAAAAPLARPPKAAVALALVFACGMFCTQLDLSQQRLPRAYAGGPPSGLVAGAAELPSIDGAARWDASPATGRRGRVLLSTSGPEDFAEDFEGVGGKGGAGGMHGQRQLLIVTLLDHLVGQLPASPTLFRRLCSRLNAMGVLDTCPPPPPLVLSGHAASLTPY